MIAIDVGSLGWIACSWDDPELRFVHLRVMGSSQDNVYTGRMRHGYGQYFMGTGIVYMFATSVYRMLHPPYFLAGIAMFWGYLKSAREKASSIPGQGATKIYQHLSMALSFAGKAQGDGVARMRSKNLSGRTQAGCKRWS